MYNIANKTLLSLVLFFSLGLFIYYCGTTAVVEESISGDTSMQDIQLNKDAITDISKDTTAADTIENDSLTEDSVSIDTNVEDILEDVSIEDIRESDTITDLTVEDIDMDGGGDGGGKDTSYNDNEITDTSIKTYSISGKVTVNGGDPEKGKQVFVFLFDQVPNENVNPVAYTTTDSNNDYIFEDVPQGSYYVFAIYDIDGNNNPEPDQGDPVGYYNNNPVSITNGSITGVNINITTIQLSVLSVFMQRQQSRNAYLISLTARILDPKSGEPIENATVTAIDNVNPQMIHTLTYNSQTQQYEKQFNPYSQNAVIAVDGEYTFTIQHPSYGSQPVKLNLNHKPFKELITIIQPQNNSTIKVGEDLTVEWKNPADVEANLLIQVMRRVGNQMQEVFKDENQPINNPYTIDGSYLNETGMYLINVVSGRFRLVKNGASIEATSGTVITQAQ